jgi:hypothetical protein
MAAKTGSMNGFYSLVFRGLHDWGMAILVLKDGLICGTDTNAVEIDGMYRLNGDALAVDVTITVPPGVALVQGLPAQPTTYQIPIKASFPLSRIGTSEPTLIHTPAGPLNTLLRKLRDLTI